MDLPNILLEPVTGVQSWDRNTLGRDTWYLGIDDDCRRELSDALRQLRDNPIDRLLLTGSSFALPACAALMKRAKDELDRGRMFVVLDRLPVDEISKDEATTLYWLMCSLMSRPVAQKFDGTMLFDVIDRKVDIVPGSGLRPTISNVDLTFHNDNSYGAVQPDYIGLLCLGTPAAGGTSRVASVHTVHNRLLARHKATLPRLYRPFPYDRYREHAPGDDGVSRYPVFTHRHGNLSARVAIPEIRAGYKLLGESPSDDTAEAIAALEEVFRTPDLAAEFQLDVGQIQLANNRHALHSRTEFTDSPDGTRTRHLVRLWLRDRGARSYTGLGAAPMP